MPSYRKMKHWKMLVLLLCFWLVVVLYMTSSVPSSLDAATRVEQTMSRTIEELDRLYEQNKKLEQLINQLNQNNETHHSGSQDSVVRNLKSRLNKAHSDLSRIADFPNETLTYEGEHARRKAENTVKELWYFLESEIKKLEEKSKHDNWPARISKLKQELEGYKRTMFDDFDKLRRANKAEKYRQQRLKELGNLVQRRLKYLQNPVNCKAAKTIVCNLHKGCGFGCQLHHVTFCLITAYAMERTLILDSKQWRYALSGWETVFEPLSNTCSNENIEGSRTSWLASVEEMSGYSIIELTIVDNLHPRPDFMPLAVPADLAHELSILHGDPAVWWIGQIVHYLFQLNPVILHDVHNSGKKMGFQNIIVGVHVRRTDKIDIEAAFHGIKEYMVHVEEYFNQLERTHTNITRRVYLASDDPGVLAEAHKQYPKYIFIGDSSISQSAALGTRYSDNSLRGIIIDIYYLARCDFLVCTFSSQVCRVAYELMQALHGDASNNFRSLDDIFYYGGQNAHNVIVVEAHQGNSEGMLDIQPGDVVGIAGNHWNGYSKGLNRRTGLSGLFPSYKAKDVVVPVRMHTYPKVPLKDR